MLFRDGFKTNLPRKAATQQETIQAKDRDRQIKEERKTNSAKHKSSQNFKGDNVLVRNYRKQSKFEPYFLPERYVVLERRGNSKVVFYQTSK